MIAPDSIRGWLLDTVVLSEPTKRSPDQLVLAWLRAQDRATLYTHSLALAELRQGIARAADPQWRASLTRWLETRIRPLFAGRLLEADEATWSIMLRIIERAKVGGRTVPVTDLILAAAAERHGMAVVTRNVKHFAGTGVLVLNPWLPEQSASVA